MRRAMVDTTDSHKEFRANKHSMEVLAALDELQKNPSAAK